MKCSCAVCGKHIEYDAGSAGVEIACPHCGQTTKLAAYAPAPPPLPSQPFVPAQSPPRRRNAWIVVLVLAIGLVLVIPVIGLLAAIAIPNFVKARQASQRAACVANLQAIDGAKAAWAVQHKKTNEDVPSEAELFSAPYMSGRPVCHANGFYTIGRVDEKPTCTVPGHEL